MEKINRVVLSRVPDHSELARSDGRGYWGFECYDGLSLEAVGSADEFATALSMAQECVLEIEKAQGNHERKKPSLRII